MLIVCQVSWLRFVTWPLTRTGPDRGITEGVSWVIVTPRGMASARLVARVWPWPGAASPGDVVPRTPSTPRTRPRVAAARAGGSEDGRGTERLYCPALVGPAPRTGTARAGRTPDRLDSSPVPEAPPQPLQIA